MTNLLNELTEQDRDTIREYIYTYGGARESTFIGLDQWLYHWAGANKTLFKLLGNKLIYEFPIDYEKTQFQLAAEFRSIIYCYVIHYVELHIHCIYTYTHACIYYGYIMQYIKTIQTCKH